MTLVAESMSPDMVKAVASGIAIVIAALGALIVQLHRVFKAHAKIETTNEQKLDKITLLVNGRYAEVLRELAEVRGLVAKLTGLDSDHEKASHAQRVADDQQSRVQTLADMDVTKGRA